MPGRLVFSTTADGASSPTERMRITSAGNVLVGRTYKSNEKIGIGGGTATYSTGTSATGFADDTTVSSAQTNLYTSYSSYISTQAAAFTLGNLTHFKAAQFAIGAGSSVTSQYGFFADAALTGATNNFGFYSNIASGTGRFNFYANGTAINYFAGNVGIGTTSPNELLHVASGGNTKARISSSFSGSTDTGLIIDTTGDSSIGAISFHKAGSSRGDIAYFHNATGASEQLRFNVAGGSADLVIDGSGRVGIGTTSAQARLHVEQSSAGDAAYFAYNGSTGGGAAIRVSNGFSSTDPIYSFWFNNTAGIGNPATNQVSFITGNQERARIDSSGRLLVGTSSSVTNGQGDARLQVTTNSSNYYTADFGHFSNDAFAGAVYFKKSRSTTAGGFASVVDGDFLGDIRFAGADGTGYIRAALIECRVDGTPGTNDMPGRLVFSTTADGTSSPTERLRIDSAGQIEAGSLGTAAVPVWSFLSDPNTGIYSPGADQVAISTNGTGRLFVDASGTVQFGGSSGFFFVSATNQIAIGGNTYTKDLTINKTDAAIALRASSGGTYSSQGLFFYVDGTAQSQIHNDGSGNILFRNTSALTERMRLDSSGRLGLGTSSPSSELHVQGALSGGQLLVANSGTNSVEKYGTFGTVHYTNAEEPALGLAVQSSPTENNVVIGGALGEFNAATSVRFYTAANNTTTTGSERARIDSSGRLLVGTSTAVDAPFGTTQGKLIVAGQNEPLIFGTYAANQYGTRIDFIKSRSATVNGKTVVQANDELGELLFAGTDGTNPIAGARIRAEVDGTPGTNDMPGRLVFSTTADGASSPTERMRIAQNGVITIQNGAVAVIGTLTDAATITPDLAADCNFTVTLGGARTIANPTNITAGQSGSIFIVQDGVGNRTTAWGSFWDFSGGVPPTLSTAANAVDRVDYIVRSATSIHTVFTANYS
jgi:hypothetical protein